MANLPALTSQGEPIADIIVDQRDLLDSVSLTLESALSKLDSIDNILRQQFNAQLRQIENAEFAQEEARREADRNRLAGNQADQATAQPVREGSDTSNFASGLMGGLAAAGVGSTLRMLAGRLVTGGGLAAIGLYFGEEIGKFLQTEADSFLDDAELSSEITDKITSGLAENLDTALIGAGLSKFIFGRTLPGLIAGFVLGGLDIEKLFSSDENIRAEFYGTFSDGDTPGTGLRGELEKGWDAIVGNKETATILTGAGAGVLAVMTRGPLITKIAAGLIGAYGLSNLMPSSEDQDSFNSTLENAVVNELELLGFGQQGAETAVDVGGAAITGLSTSWLFGLINKRLKIPAFIAGFIWDYFDLSRIFTQEGKDDLLNKSEEEVRRLLAGEGATEDYIDAVIATLGLGYAAKTTYNAVRSFPTFRPDGTIEGEGQQARPGPRPAPQTGQFVRPRRPNGQFMSDAEITDMYEQQISNTKYKRVYRNVLKGLAFLGVALTALEAFELYQILNSDAKESLKRAAVGSFIGGFIGAISGGAGGAAIGLYFGPWGALIVGALGAGVGGLAGGVIGEYIAGWAFEDTPPEYQTEEQYQEFLRTNRENFERGPNVGIIEGVTGDPSGAIVRTSPSYAEQFGPGSSTPQVQIVPTQPESEISPEQVEIVPTQPESEISPEQAAIVESITGLQTELEILQAERNIAQERLAAASGRNRRGGQLRINRLTDEIEALSEELEKLNDALEPSLEPTAPSNISYNTPSYSRPQTFMAAFRPSFGNARLMNASLSTDTPSTTENASVEQIREALKAKESSGDYTAESDSSSASGAYQYVDSTWKSVTSKYGIGQEYARAKDAPPEIQDEVARRNIQEILAENNGNVAAVPNVWYSGNAQGKLTEEGLAANQGYTQERYSADFFRRLGQQPPQVASGDIMDDSNAFESMTGPTNTYSGAFANLLSSGFADPEAALTTLLQSGFSNLSTVTPEAINLANRSVAESSSGPVVINNNNVVNGGAESSNGGGDSKVAPARSKVSSDRAIDRFYNASVESTILNTQDAVFSA